MNNKIVVVICALMCLNLNAKQTIKYKAGILCRNDIEYPMVNVDGGRFYMGASLIQEDIFDNQDTVHIVSVNNFRIGKFEVTQEMWDAVMGSNPSNFKGPKRPVDSVSWNDCLSFISKLNELTGKKSVCRRKQNGSLQLWEEKRVKAINIVEVIIQMKWHGTIIIANI